MILAACPYCKVGKVRAPHTAIGASATCPRCFNSFTIVDSEPSRSGPPRSTSATRASAVAAMPELAEPDSDTEEPAEPELNLPPIVAPLPPPPRRPGRDAESSFALAMVAFIFAGVSFALTYVPYGRLLSLLPALGGVALGLFGLVVADKRRIWPALGTGLNLLIVFLVVALPTWIGLGRWVPPRAEVIDGPRLMPFDSSVGSPIDDGWIDAARGGWQKDDVRVTVNSSSVARVGLVGPKKAEMASKDAYLVIRVNVRNFGGGLAIDFRSWNAPPTADSPRVRA